MGLISRVSSRTYRNHETKMAGLTNSLIINELPSDNPPDAKLKALLLELFTQVAPVTNVRISRYGPSKSRRQGHIDFVYDSSVEFSMLALKNCKLFGKKLSMAPQRDMSASSLHRALVRGPASQNTSMNNSMNNSVVCLDDEILDISDSKSNSRRSINGNSSSFQGNSSINESSSNEQRRGAKENHEANGNSRHNSRQNTSSSFNNNTGNSRNLSGNNSGNNSRNSSRNSNRNSSEKAQTNGRESGECDDSEHAEHDSDLSDGEVGGQVISHKSSPFVQKAVEKVQNSNNSQSKPVPLFQRRQQSQSQPNLTTVGQSHNRPGHTWGQRNPGSQGPPRQPPNQPVSQRYGMPPQRPPMYRSTAPYANQTYQYNNQQQQNYRGGYR